MSLTTILTDILSHESGVRWHEGDQSPGHRDIISGPRGGNSVQVSLLLQFCVNERDIYFLLILIVTF